MKTTHFFLLATLLLLSAPALAGDGCKAMFAKLDKIPKDSLKPAKYRQLMQEFAKDDNGECAPVLQRMIGFYFLDRGQLDSAISAQATCAKMYEAVKEPIGVASAYGNVAVVYELMGQYTLALQYERFGLQIYLAQNYTLGILSAYEAIGEKHYQLGNIDSTTYYINKSIDLKLKNNYFEYLSSNYGLLALCSIERNNTEAARKYINMAEAALAKETDEEWIANSYGRIGEVYGKLREYKTCFLWLRKALALDQKLGRQTSIKYDYENFANYFKEANQLDSAWHYLDLQNALNDSINSENFQEALTKEALKADNQKREFELQEAKLKKERSQLISVSVVLISIVVLIAVLLLLRSNTIKRKALEKEKALEAANATIRGQDEERARVAVELHDRVGSMISTAKHQLTVSLEHATLPEPERALDIMRLLDQTSDEVRMISHNLSDGAVTKHGLDTALRNLCASNSILGKHSVKYISTGATIPLSTDSQMDLYRITQELLNNALKYANANELSIQISISDNNIVYSYEDDGQGFDKAKLVEKPGIGYQNVETRVKRMNATWYLDTAPGNGTNVIIEIPLA